MTDQNSKSEKDERRFSQEQYDMLKHCWKKNDMKEWNNWREQNPKVDILLEGQDFSGWYLKDVNLSVDPLCAGKKSVIGLGGRVGSIFDLKHTEVHLEGAIFEGTELVDAALSGAHLEGAQLHSNLEGAIIRQAHLDGAILNGANLQRAKLNEAELRNCKFIDADLRDTVFFCAKMQGACVRTALVSGVTSFWEIDINRKTNFLGTGLGNVRIHPKTKQLLEYNIRRKNWEEWYKEHWLLRWPVRWFWCISNYGISTWRIIAWFFGLAIAFVVIYRLWPSLTMVRGGAGDLKGFWHALYFSVVTMTTLGFGDIAANPDSWWGQTLLMVQVILGYVLLGALITRFAVLFTAGGPAGKFADEKTVWERLKKLWDKFKKKN